jgi:predicted nucleotidyltransferase
VTADQAVAAPGGDRVVAAAVRGVLACVDPDLVLLFGSRSTGRVGPHSDLDLIVVADVGKRQAALARELRETLARFAMPVDVILVTPAEVAAAPATSFLGSVVATAQVVYPRSPEQEPDKERAPQDLTGDAHS